MTKKSYLELICYGMMSVFAAFLFIFGTMYPRYIFTAESYRVLTVEGLSEEELQRSVYELDRSKIKVSGKIYEGILKLLEDKEDDERCISDRVRSTVSEWGCRQDGNDHGWKLL